MGKVISLQGNRRGYAHVVCACANDTFAVKTSERDDGKIVFFSLICDRCGNEIFVEMTPVFGPSKHDEA